jgi:hypothetical protein
MWTMTNWMMCNDWNTEGINADIAVAIMSQLSSSVHVNLIFGVQSKYKNVFCLVHEPSEHLDYTSVHLPSRVLS